MTRWTGDENDYYCMVLLIGSTRVPAGYHTAKRKTAYYRRALPITLLEQHQAKPLNRSRLDVATTTVAHTAQQHDISRLRKGSPTYTHAEVGAVDTVVARLSSRTSSKNTHKKLRRG